LEAHPDDFVPFVEHDGSFTEYVENMRKSETWGGDVEIQALVRMHEVHIWVHQPAQENPTDACPLLKFSYSDATSETKVAQLAYHPNYHAGKHFNSVWRKELERRLPTEEEIRQNFEACEAKLASEKAAKEEAERLERIEKSKPRGLAARQKLW